MAYPFFSSHPIRWSELSLNQVRPDVRRGLELAEERITAIESLDLAVVDYASTFEALEAASDELGQAWSLVNHLDSVRNSPQLREAINDLLPEVTAFFSGIPLRSALWERFKAAQGRIGSEELHPQQLRYVEETIADFREAGADLEEDAKAELREVDGKLAQLTQTFSEQVLDATNAWELYISDESRLVGLPQNALDSAAQSAQSKGHKGWRFTLHMPSLLPVLKHAKDASLRQELWEASSAVGRGEGCDNRPLVQQILAKRQRKAELLGRDHFPDLVLARRMAGDGETARRFVADLRERVADQAHEEAGQLEVRAAQDKGGESKALDPWDLSFYAETLRQERYEFDNEALRPYLPLRRVMGGMFELCEELFSIRIVARQSACVSAGETLPEGGLEVWHPEVLAYELQDQQSAQVLGVFYTDWHPREEKRGGAWMNPIQSNDPEGYNGTATPHIGCICGNMSAPIGDQPALMLHEEVETIFHEFGHLLHHLLGDSRVRSLSGTHVPWDFVELPSQIMENWCWDRASLNRFARHWETDQIIPDELFERMIQARNFRAASFFMSQLHHGMLDLDMHLNPQLWIEGDVDELNRERLVDYRARTSRPPLSMAPRFTHLFGSATGYAAGYYSYKWAEVLDADAFTRFLSEGPANPETGRAFRDEILSRGNTRPVEESFRAFMGRDPDPEALLVRSDLA